jgi:hypothetical protein
MTSWLGASELYLCIATRFVPFRPAAGCIAAQPGWQPAARARTRRLAEYLPVGCLLESHEQGTPLSESGRSQVARRSEQEVQQVAPGRPAGSQVDMDHALAFGDVDLVHIAEDAQRMLALDGLLLGVDLSLGDDLSLRKEPLRLGAGLSAFAVIAPVHRCHRASPLVQAVTS